MIDDNLREAKRLKYRPFSGSGVDQAKGSEAGEPAFFKRARAFAESEGSSSDVKLSAKIVVVGASNVGKTALMVRHCEGTFSENYKATIGVDFMASRFLVDEIRFVLQIWDTAGQERFRSVSTAFFRGAMCCIACFDVSDPSTIEQTKTWVQQVKAENPGSFSTFLVGCKSDLYHAVTTPQAAALAQELNAEYFECSSKTGQRVDELFERVACVLFDQAICVGSDESKPISVVKPRSNGAAQGAKKANVVDSISWSLERHMYRRSQNARNSRQGLNAASLSPPKSHHLVFKVVTDAPCGDACGHFEAMM
eukprot:CAMPEP_0196656780 /NCGR_PEP_ID=MMETSP1086-20130531/19436_1 /TAXON_ID=77921 /ORGANISM="Cyanoptyche  gloeocystis , Strain SAG4.97" /LENGTH=308 /DNA_ID=CAMNT_0041989645 /DNA_START=16 /DNA_END=943 /DNA_ORIENTATION=-